MVHYFRRHVDSTASNGRNKNYVVAGVERRIHCNVTFVDRDTEQFRVEGQFVARLQLTIQLGGCDRVRCQFER